METETIYKNRHTTVLVLIIVFFIYLLVSNYSIIYEPFKKFNLGKSIKSATKTVTKGVSDVVNPSKKDETNNDDAKKNAEDQAKLKDQERVNADADWENTKPRVYENDLSYGVVSITTEPYSKATASIQIGMVPGGTAREVRNYRNVVGMNVPAGLRVTIYELPDFKGHFNAIVGPNTWENTMTGEVLQYSEEEAEEGGLKVNTYGGVGWQYRVNSFIVHRWMEVPDTFDSTFYGVTYGINNYNDYVALGENLSNIPDQTRDAQWQDFLDKGQTLGHKTFEGEKTGESLDTTSGISGMSGF